MPVTPFEKAYASLNEKQKLSVDTLEGPVMVLAGPGTGKTQVLTLRIANILAKTDTDPSSILALTFTDAAAKEMRGRLLDLIGQPAHYLRVTTFHSFCSEIIAENPDRFSRPSGMSPATELEKIEIINRLLEHEEFLFLKPLNNPTLYLRDIISRISDLKREGITPEKYTKLVRALSEEFDAEKDELSKTAFTEKEKLVGKNVDLLKLYQKYNDELVRLGRFDFDDMINWVVEAFETDPEFLLPYQEKYQYFLVDEYQDTNSAQNRLVFALAGFFGENANLFVVGDPNQSIFRFQGASEENVRQFTKHFPKAKKITLTHNYRSTKPLLSSAASLIKGESLKKNAPHKPVKIKAVQFPDSLHEDDFLVKSIQEKIVGGANPADIAVIVKENKEIDHLSSLFKQKGIPYRLEGGANILATSLVSQFLEIANLVTTLSDPDDLALFTVLNYPFFDLNPLSLLKLARQSARQKIPLVDVLAEDKDIDSNIAAVFSRFFSWSKAARHETLPQIFQRILWESGLMDHILGLPRPIIELGRFTTLYEEAKRELEANPKLDLAGFVKNLKLMEEHGLKLPEVSLSGTSSAVTITTAHKSKGLEWLIVYIYRFADAHWGNKWDRQMIKLPDSILESKVDASDKEADERRLFYVALTRAKQEVLLLGATSYETSSRMTFPSVFLSDLPEIHLSRKEISSSENEIARRLTELLTPPPAVGLVDGEEEYLRSLIADFKLSPTALNNYLECRYKFKLDNLYKIPKAKAPSLCFGTAVHATLENLYRKLNQTGILEPKAEFLSDLETALRREVLSESELKNRLAHGLKILSAYYDHFRDEFAPTLATEKNFGRSNPILLDDIPLTGKIDRIDRLPDSKKVRFVDYKTGKPKTRGVLTKEADGPDGNYKRQLVFYQLLSQLDKTFGQQVAETILDFLEPDERGRFHREAFVIAPAEVNHLKETIRTAMKGIRSLDFSRTSDKTTCSRCDFRKHCHPAGL